MTPPKHRNHLKHSKAIQVKRTNDCTEPRRQDKQLTDEITRKDGTRIEVLPIPEHVKYFGKLFNLVDHTDKDIDERIQKGFRQFNEFRSQLCPKDISKNLDGAYLNQSSRTLYCTAHAPGP